MSMGRHDQTGSDGFILVAVLWVLGALAALATIYTIYVANTALAVAVNDDAVQADAIASAAVELAAYELLKAPPDHRPTRGAFSFRMRKAQITVEFCSEAARIDLNEAPKELLAGLFGALGAHPNDAAQYADRILGWRTPPGENTLDSEASLYGAAGLSYSPRGAPFEHVDELWLVLGLPSAMVERAMPYVTVYSGRQDINVLDAAPEVIAALPGMTPLRLNTILGDRPTLTGNRESFDLAELGPGQAHATLEGSKATRVTTHIAFDNGRPVNSEAVILVDAGGEPFRVLSWRANLAVQPGVVRLGMQR
jgi:general secretion pathway protein K